MLHDFLTDNRAEIITRCRAKVAARSIAPPPEQGIEHGVPLFLDELAEILRIDDASSAGIRENSVRHGHELLRMGFTVGQVVHEYGDVCQAVTELALERRAPITTGEFRTFNRCLDDAIANAVTEYVERREQLLSQEARKRHGFFAHELRDLLSTATLSFQVLRSGGAVVGASGDGLLGRSLSRLRDFVERSLTSVRLEAPPNRERLAVDELIDEIEIAAAVEAGARGIRFTVERAGDDAAVEVDRQILTSIVANLLHNAFKFTRLDGLVCLRSFASADRILIEVADECGGLPPGDPEALFLPFQQGPGDRTGLGLGLAISHRGTEACGGALSVRNLPGTGCVFTVDLPRALATTSADERATSGSERSEAPGLDGGASGVRTSADAPDDDPASSE